MVNENGTYLVQLQRKGLVVMDIFSNFSAPLSHTAWQQKVFTFKATNND
jgi:hypothetical protein